MCSRPAWPLRIITRRTPLRTKSARTSRTKTLSASTETLTVPGYGRVVVQTPYGIGGATQGRVRGGAPFDACSAAELNPPPGGGRPRVAPRAAPGGGDANPPAPRARHDRRGRRARRAATHLPADRCGRRDRRGHRVGLPARPGESDCRRSRTPCLCTAVAPRPEATRVRLSGGGS